MTPPPFGRSLMLDMLHLKVQIIIMKKRDLERKLTEYGWYLLRQGNRHEMWTNGTMTEPVPRHSEIAEMLAKKIIRKAKDNRGE
jgi:mRNA interferase HicA